MYGDAKKDIIIYRYNDSNSKYSKEFQIIMKIFQTAKANVFDIEEGMQLLQSYS